MIAFTQNMINKIKKADFDAMEGSEVGNCPLCKAPVTERGRSYQCNKNCGFKLSKRILSWRITPAIAKELLKDGKTSQLFWFKSSQGKKFQAHLKLENNEIKFEFVDHRTLFSTKSPAVHAQNAKVQSTKKLMPSSVKMKAVLLKLAKKFWVELCIEMKLLIC
jgi:hypothetical protein